MNMTVMGLIVLAPLAMWTMKQICALYKNVPVASLKAPAILIFLGPAVFQATSIALIHAKSETALALIALAQKILIIVLLYSFYFLLREVVFYEHLLAGTEALNAEPAFTDAGSSHSQVSGGVFSLTPVS
mgnify:CR=1 FL=1